MIRIRATRDARFRWAGWILAVGLVAVLFFSAPPASSQESGGGQGNSADPAGENNSAEPRLRQTDDTAEVRRSSEAPANPAPDQPSAQAPSPEPGTLQAPKNPTDYGLWVLTPALVAILLAIVARQVIPALAVGILVGAYMMVPCLGADDPFSDLGALVAGFRLAAERYMFGELTVPDDGYFRLKIIVFTLVIGFMIGVIGRNGGTAGMVKLVVGETASRRRGALTAWLAGLVVFFDDYANTMIVGPTMRSVFDRLKLSRAKLAYIVDSTAAPVASIAVVGTWVGAEITYIQTGIDDVAGRGAPAFLVDSQGDVIGGMQAFLYSIPYRFYPILALVLVFLIAFTGRDFGPMKRAERKLLSRIEPDKTAADEEAQKKQEPKARWWLGLPPIVVLVGATVAVLAVTGYHGAGGAEFMQQEQPWWEKVSRIIGKGDAYLSIFYGAILSAIVAVILTMVSRACAARDAFDAGLEGTARMASALVILVLAWALSGVLTDLMLGNIVANYLEAQQFPAQWLPLAVFLCAAVVSFATGTSCGYMGILCPVTVAVAARLIEGIEGIGQAEALSLFYASIGSVLAGAVFGDHCSPISDTTVLSSIASGCRHEEHVWTQIPYALLAAIASMGLGDVLCSVYGQPWYVGLGAGAVLLVFVVYIVGQRPVPSFELADA